MTNGYHPRGCQRGINLAFMPKSVSASRHQHSQQKSSIPTFRFCHALSAVRVDRWISVNLALQDSDCIVRAPSFMPFFDRSNQILLPTNPSCTAPVCALRVLHTALRLHATPNLAVGRDCISLHCILKSPPIAICAELNCACAGVLWSRGEGGRDRLVVFGSAAFLCCGVM